MIERQRADGNKLQTLEIGSTMPSLRVLRICDNPIKALDSTNMPGLRTIVADRTALGDIVGLSKLKKLEMLSLREDAVRMYVVSFRMCAT